MTTPQIIDAEHFSILVESEYSEKDLDSYMDAVMVVCDRFGIDFEDMEDIRKVKNKYFSRPLLEKIKTEFENRRMVKPEFRTNTIQIPGM